MQESTEQWQVISRYTREQAIDDGVLVDVTDESRKLGFRYPVAISTGVLAVLAPWDTGAHGDFNHPPKGHRLEEHGQSYIGRLHDLLTIMLYSIRHGDNGDGSRIDFAPLFLMPRDSTLRPRPVPMYSLCGPGDNAEPVITIMLPTED